MFEGCRSLTVQTFGTTTHAVCGGDGPPLLLIHGYPQTHGMWHKIAPRLAASFAWVRRKLAAWSRDDSAFAPAAVAEYVRCFSDPAAIHGTCEDHRAAAAIDLRHDEADMGRKVACPLLVLWVEGGVFGRRYDVLAVWRERAADVRGHAVPSGHFLPEETPEEAYEALRAFFAG